MGGAKSPSQWPTRERMMKKLKIILFLCLFASFMFGDWSEKLPFIDTAIASITTGATATDGSEYNSNKIPISTAAVAITGEFTIAAPDGSNIEFRIFACYDGTGTNWSFLVTLTTESNITAATGNTRRRTFNINAEGVSHLKVQSIKNNDANTISNVNVYMSDKT